MRATYNVPPCFAMVVQGTQVQRAVAGNINTIVRAEIRIKIEHKAHNRKPLQSPPTHPMLLVEHHQKIHTTTHNTITVLERKTPSKWCPCHCPLTRQRSVLRTLSGSRCRSSPSTVRSGWLPSLDRGSKGQPQEPRNVSHSDWHCHSVPHWHLQPHAQSRPPPPFPIPTPTPTRTPHSLRPSPTATPIEPAATLDL